jgi:hypothetical protein
LEGWRRCGVRLVGPLSLGSNWQSGVPRGITVGQFEIDRQRHTTRWPMGERPAQTRPASLPCLAPA